MTAKLDKITESRARETVLGIEVERIAHVSSLSGSPSRKLVEALSAPGIPKYGDRHPDVPLSTVREIQAEPLAGEGTMRVRIVYLPDRGGEAIEQRDIETRPDFIAGIEFSAETIEETTNTDINGELMKADYTGQPDLTSQLAGQVVLRRDIVNVTYLKHVLACTIEVNHSTIPKKLAATYIGATNADRWSGFDPLTWLVTEVNTRKIEQLWRTRFRFLHRDDNWRVKNEIKIRGRTPQDARVGNGFNTYMVYAELPFSALRVSF